MKRPAVQLGVFLLLLGTFNAGALRNEFYWDDRALILEGKLIRSWSSLPAIFTHEMWHNVDLGKRAPRAKIDTYRPLSNTSFLLDHQLWGTNPAGYHATNVLIHLANTALVFLLLSSFVSSRAALLGAALFGFHPQTAECVHYVSARTDSLAAFFLLLALWIAARRPRLSLASLLASAGAYLCGVLVKETVLVFAPLLPLVMHGTGRMNSRRELVRVLITLIGVTALYFILRFHALGGAKAVADRAQVLELFLNLPRLTAHFFRSALVPLSNMPMQRFPVVRPPASPLDWGIGVAFALGSLALFAVFLAGRRRPSLIGVFVILLCLAPPLVAVTMTEDLGPRYFYLPLAGFVWLLACGSDFLTRRNFGFLERSAASLLFVFFALQTARVAPWYRTEVSFYEKITADSPGYFVSEYNLGNAYARGLDWRNAVRQFERALALRPRDPSVANNLAVAYLNLGEYTSALPHIEEALSRSPGTAKYHFNYALVLHGLGRTKESRAELVRALSLDPSYARAREWASRICAERTPDEETCRPLTDSAPRTPPGSGP